MNPEIEKLVRKHVLTLKPYSSARDEYEGSDGVFLDANENPFGSVSGGSYNRYPDPYQRELKTKIAQLKGLREEQIFLGNGSDEIIDVLFRTFCEPAEDSVMTFPPTFGMYEASAGINQVEVLSVPLTSHYQLDLEGIKARIDEEVKIVFVCSPNNPTGNLIDRSLIEELLELSSGLVVVDEAYGDFAPEASSLNLLNKHVNLVVLQTFSKAWGMANLRLGMGFCHPDIISMMNKVKMPYNVNGLSQRMALEALDKVELRDEMVAKLLEERDYLKEELEKQALVEHIYPSDANFLLVKFDQADKRYKELIEEQVVVRNRSRVLLCEDCLRITVGTRAENEELLKSLRKLA
ncbi:MAG: histidinol-phosphate transaminase [Bacteroidia bacterium]|nr:histidinol-phosphate transaminase [Bacteroidia bacterium]